MSASGPAANPRQQALLSTGCLVVCGRHSSTAATSCSSSSNNSSRTRVGSSAAAAGESSGGEGAAASTPSVRRGLSSSSSPAPAVEAASPSAPKLVFGIPKEDHVVRTPPMEEEDSGPVIREMRVQLRPRNEQGSRGARRIRRGRPRETR